MPNLERGASQRDSSFLFSLVFQFFIFNSQFSIVSASLLLAAGKFFSLPLCI